jgi:hypothetical protein
VNSSFRAIAGICLFSVLLYSATSFSDSKLEQKIFALKQAEFFISTGNTLADSLNLLAKFPNTKNEEISNIKKFLEKNKISLDTKLEPIKISNDRINIGSKVYKIDNSGNVIGPKGKIIDLSKSIALDKLFINLLNQSHKNISKNEIYWNMFFTQLNAQNNNIEDISFSTLILMGRAAITLAKH